MPMPGIRGTFHSLPMAQTSSALTKRPPYRPNAVSAAPWKRELSVALQMANGAGLIVPGCLRSYTRYS